MLGGDGIAGGLGIGGSPNGIAGIGIAKLILGNVKLTPIVGGDGIPGGFGIGGNPNGILGIGIAGIGIGGIGILHLLMR
jgi:hypothetical protein